MKQKMIILITAMFVLIVVIAAISAYSWQHRDTAEESFDAPQETTIVIVPSEMPDRIMLDIPVGFTETTSSYYDKYYVQDDASIIVTGEPLAVYGQDVKSYGETVKAQYQQAVEDFNLVTEEIVNISGVDCAVYEFTYVLSSPDTVQQMQCITAVAIKDDRVYLVTCKSRFENFMYYQQPFRDMLKTIRIADESLTTTASETITQAQTLPVT